MDEKGQQFPKNDLARLARHGVVTRTQLLAAGSSSEQGRYAVRGGRLHRVHAGVYAVGRPLETPLQLAHAAVLACGERAALGGLSALALADLHPWPTRPVVLVARRVRRPVIEVHFTSTLKRADVHRRQGISTITVERALLDTAAELGPQRLRRAVGAALRRRLTSRTKPRAVIARNPSHPGGPLLRPLIDPRTRSPLEDDFLTFCIRHGLPTPQALATPFGYEADAWFPVERVIVELDSEEWHLDRRAFRADRERDAHHAAHGVLTVRLLAERLTSSEADRLHRILATRRRVT